ncbi:hypothetical protein LEP1GSC172_2502 [Leptospira noguchii]|uniref:Uncharacterized protein n=1 Tax=Leptospira noguchii TaxID=28182 RepID=M6VQB3_9LEPT|nr:hypothetical protein LEP1GSC172_2502 [Leptospira noguchii]
MTRAESEVRQHQIRPDFLTLNSVYLKLVELSPNFDFTDKS